jgi:uncharacterized protein Smg (DUF494 family)
MSFAQVLQELPPMTIEQRQLLIHRALELDDPPLASEDEALVEPASLQLKLSFR